MAKMPSKEKPTYRAFWGSRGGKKSHTPETFAGALGDAILAWSYAENTQTYCFAELLGIDPSKAHRLYQKLPNFRSRTAALLMLVELHPECAALKEPILKLSGLSKTRNLYIHGFYIISLDNEKIRLIDFDEPLGPKRSRMTKANDVHQHADAVRNWAKALDQALRHILATKPGTPIPRHSRTRSPRPRSTPAQSRRRTPPKLP